MTERYCYSYDQERYEGDCATRDEALAEAIEERDDEERPTTVWTARSVAWEIPDHVIRADHVTERLAELASEDVSEVADDWPFAAVSPGADEELEAAIAAVVRAWIAKHAPPNFWIVADVRKHDIDAVQP